MDNDIATEEVKWRPIQEALHHYVSSPLRREAQRIFHGRSGQWPELVWCNVDGYWPVILITVYQEPPKGFLKQLLKTLGFALEQKADEGLTHVAVQRRDLPAAPTDFIHGEPLSCAYARRRDQRYEIRFDRQNIGFFTDIEPARQWLESEVRGKTVLNLFAFTCVFSVVALRAGADRVVNVDLSRSALERGRRNHEENDLDVASVSFEALDILKSWGRIRRRGPFDIILIDPPSFQRGSFVATRDYAKVIRRIPQLAAQDAVVLACLNAPELSEEFLLEQFQAHCPDAILRQKLRQDPKFYPASEPQPLKMLVFDWRSQEAGS